MDFCSVSSDELSHDRELAARTERYEADLQDWLSRLSEKDENAMAFIADCLDWDIQKELIVACCLATDKTAAAWPAALKDYRREVLRVAQVWFDRSWQDYNFGGDYDE